MDVEREWLIRQYAFEFLEGLGARDHPTSRAVLENGFAFQGLRIPLMSQRGIWRPKSVALPISITTSPKDPGDASASRGRRG